MGLIFPALEMDVVDFIKKKLGLSLENPEEDLHPKKIYAECFKHKDLYDPYPLHEEDVRDWKSFLSVLLNSKKQKIVSLKSMIAPKTVEIITQSLSTGEIYPENKKEIIKNLNILLSGKDFPNKLNIEVTNQPEAQPEYRISNRKILESVLGNELIKTDDYITIDIGITRNGVRLLISEIYRLINDNKGKNETISFNFDDSNILHSKSQGLIIKLTPKDVWEKEYPVTQGDINLGVYSSSAMILIKCEEEDSKTYAVIQGAEDGLRGLCNSLVEYFLEYNINHVHYGDFTYMFIPGSLYLTVFLAKKLEDN